MFWRLFLTYMLFVMLAVIAVGVLILQRSGGQEIFLALSREVTIAVVAIILFSVAPAFFLARQMTHPMDELAEGAQRLANGDFEYRFPLHGGTELATVAAAFNAMTNQLSKTFAQLASDRGRLRAILSGMAEGVIAIDNEQRILFANERAGALFEFDPEPAKDQLIGEVVKQHPIAELVQRALTKSEPHREVIDWHGSAEKILALYISRAPGATFVGSVIVINDVTELRRLERLRQDFVANVSHELKTPLSNIKSSVEVLIDGAVDDPKARGQFLETIAEQTLRQQELIEDLLSLAKIESGDMLFDLEPVSVEDAVHASLDRHRIRAEAKGLELNGVALTGGRRDLVVFADDQALSQVLDNLVDNAVKYTPANGRITVRWQAHGDVVRIDVIDTGQGIPEADLPRVFERFYRVDKARTRHAGGTGLGLSIAKHLVMAMNGEVSVNSELGQGTTFTVTLPRDTSV